jgi:glycosyltransferase involved in cell wall biosynthesis
VGTTPSRLLTFAWAAVCKRPHVVAGFHLIYNGIAAAIVGRLAGTRSIYICVGGTEVANDGIVNQPNCFRKATTSDGATRDRRLRLISCFDAIITMGTRAARFFRDNGITAPTYVVSGGIDSQRFYPAEETPSIDVIVTARLSVEKRLDVFLDAVKLVADELPGVQAVIVGDGDLRDQLERQARELGIEQNVHFVGHQDNTGSWLRRSKLFVLTSDLEGLPLSAMEAMTCGLPAVVSNVGDLGDLVENGVNGYLVPRRSPELLAGRIIELLSDERMRSSFSQAAHQSALRYETMATAGRWNDVFTHLRAG